MNSTLITAIGGVDAVKRAAASKRALTVEDVARDVVLMRLVGGIQLTHPSLRLNSASTALLMKTHPPQCSVTNRLMSRSVEIPVYDLQPAVPRSAS